MAVSGAKDLIKKMASDPTFRQSLQSADTKEARKAILAKAGFGSVSADDVKSVAKSEGTELTDEQLESVAGGRAIAPGGTVLHSKVEWATVIVAALALL